MCIIIKRKNKIIYRPSRQIQICPECNGTGLGNEHARLLWERKEEISRSELVDLIYKKLNQNMFLTDYKTCANFKISQMDLFQIIKKRGLWIPCSNCIGKGFIHSKINEGVELI